MGLFSSSKSKSSSNVTTTTQNAGFSELTDSNAVSNQGSGNQVLTGAGNVGVSGTGHTLNMLDGGAIEQAFRFAETQTASTGAALKESIAAVTESARTESENTVVQLKTLGVYAVAAWAAINVFKAWKS